MSFDEFNDETVLDKIRRAVSVVTGKDFEEISADFNLSDDIGDIDREYFLTMIAEFLSSNIGVEADTETVRPFATVGDLVQFVESA